MKNLIVVTGAYGFIGSKFVKYLNSQGITEIIVSDTLKNGKQFVNLRDAKFESFCEPSQIIELVKANDVAKVFHFGAISDTTCWDGEKLMATNYVYPRELYYACYDTNTLFSYSSSASVYGNGDGPLNMYAYSKHMFDTYVQRSLGVFRDVRVQGFRYFNVYSDDDAEHHKGSQASPVYQFKKQALETGVIKVFEGSDTIQRDFIHVDKVCEIQWKMSNVKNSGIFDLGTGSPQTFLDIAEMVASEHNARIEVIPFPEHLKGCYQYYTCADMSYLKDVRL